jgi:hypothetical protein
MPVIPALGSWRQEDLSSSRSVLVTQQDPVQKKRKEKKNSQGLFLANAAIRCRLPWEEGYEVTLLESLKMPSAPKLLAIVADRGELRGSPSPAGK